LRGRDLAKRPAAPARRYARSAGRDLKWPSVLKILHCFVIFSTGGIPRYLAAGERAPTGMTAMDFPKSSIYDRINNNNA
jgi:hypothetical protein